MAIPIIDGEPWWLEWVKNIVLFIAIWLTWTLRSAFFAGWNLKKHVQELAQFRTDIFRDLEDHRKATDKDLRLLSSRMDRAGEQMSEFGTHLQGLPERLRVDFIPRREVELMLAENKAERAHLATEVDNLWKIINRREEEKRRR